MAVIDEDKSKQRSTEPTRAHLKLRGLDCFEDLSNAAAEHNTRGGWDDSTV
jgi:hypothetical protein